MSFLDLLSEFTASKDKKNGTVTCGGGISGGIPDADKRVVGNEKLEEKKLIRETI